MITTFVILYFLFVFFNSGLAIENGVHDRPISTFLGGYVLPGMKGARTDGMGKDPLVMVGCFIYLTKNNMREAFLLSFILLREILAMAFHSN